MDQFAPRLSFFFAIGMNYFMEVAKLRAARSLWAELVHRFEPKSPKSMALRTHCQTSGWSLTAQDPYNNVARTCIEAMAAAHGHTQSLHTNSLDEAIALPTDHSAQIARNTQLFIQEETGTCEVIDPWGAVTMWSGSPTTSGNARSPTSGRSRPWAAWRRRSRAGFPSGASRRRRLAPRPGIDSGAQTIVGVNKLRPAREADLDILRVDNSAVRAAQIARLETLRRERDIGAVERALSALTHAAESGEGNLLALSIDAARAKATVGEMSDALEKVYGRHEADPSLDRGGVPNRDGRSERRHSTHPGARRIVRAPARPPAPHPRGQDGPGRPRPGSKGDRHRVRRPRLRRRHRAVVPDAGGNGPPRGGRTTSTSSG